MRIVVLAETEQGERRVSLVPTVVKRLVDAGHSVDVVANAGSQAGFEDTDYLKAGAKVGRQDELLAKPGVVIAVGGPGIAGYHSSLHSALGPGHVFIGVHDPLSRPSLMTELAATGASVMSLDLMPRITRAQSMDVLSSMATVAGYSAALLAADRLPKMLPLMMTAAGTIPASKFLVIGAGVAGLQAIATSRRLGASVEAYDVRPAAIEQIQSLGARAVSAPTTSADTEDQGGYAQAQAADELLAERQLLAPHVAEADAIITTAAIPGAAAPVLISTQMVEAMRPGSVIVDLAAARGGNCELSKPGITVEHHGIQIIGPTDLASHSASTASRLYANNVATFLKHLTDDNGDLKLDPDDEITVATLVTHDGEVVNSRLVEPVAVLPDPAPAQNHEPIEESA